MAADLATAAPRRRIFGRSISAWLYELWALVVTVFASLIAIGHIATTEWETTFLYNADSIVLPLVEKSVQQGEAFQWVFSSQNFFFPEGLFFAISTAFTDSPQVALYTNACLNIVVLYVLLRVIARQLAHGSRHQFLEITIALAATILFVVYVLLEPTATVNRSGTATLFLLTTYYYGVIVVGLVVLSLVLWVTRSFSPASWGRSRVKVFAVVVTLITTATVFSDPLYFAQVVAPMAVCLLILALSKRLTWRRAWVLVLPGLLGTLLGFGLRAIFADLFASNLASYFSIEDFRLSIMVLRETFVEMTSSSSGSLKLLLLASVLAITFSVMAYALVGCFRPSIASRVSTVEFFVIGFVSVSTVSLLLGHVLTGAITTRYLTPIYIFPLLTIVYVGVYLLRRLLVEVENATLRRDLSRFSVGIAIAASIVIVVVGSLNLPAVVRSASGANYNSMQCFDDFVGDSDRNGVGSFWSVRTLEVYGDARGEILQVQPDLSVYPWMNNLAPYDGTEFSFVVTDSSGQVPPEALIPLGEPAEVIDCVSYVIHDYEGTPGEAILNRVVGESADKLLE
ncbi:hypothetical protein [Conyzicola sp.]|uniref:hypothetical protein n=1 Tax=Conyzicola sp. TaxID=1969404 RepID=UPI00398A3F22